MNDPAKQERKSKVTVVMSGKQLGMPNLSDSINTPTPTPTAPPRGMSAADYLDLPKASEFLDAGQDDAEPSAVATSGDLGSTFLNALAEFSTPAGYHGLRRTGVHLPSQTSSGFAGTAFSSKHGRLGTCRAMAMRQARAHGSASFRLRKEFDDDVIFTVPVQVAGEVLEQTDSPIC